MDRFDTGNAAYHRTDYSLGAHVGERYVKIPNSNSNLGDYLDKAGIGKGTSVPTATPQGAASAPKKSFFFFQLLSFLSFRSGGEKAAQQATDQSGQAEKGELYTPAQKAKLRDMIHENYGGDEAVLNRFDQLQPQKVSSYRFWPSRQANKDSQPSEVKYSHEDLRRFLDTPAQRVALDAMVQKRLRELRAHFEWKPTSNVDYKNATKAANDMEKFLNKGDLASAHRAALAFRGFARSAMNTDKYEAAVRGENPSSLSRSSTPDSMTTEESTVSAKGQEIELHPDYEYSQKELSCLMDSSKKEIQKLQSYRMRSPSQKEIEAVKQMIQEGVKQLEFLSQLAANNHKKITTQDQLQIASKINIIQNFLSIGLKPSVTLSDLQSALDYLQEATNLYHQLLNK